MQRLITRVTVLARTRQLRTIQRLASSARSELTGVDVTVADDSVVLSGRNVLRKWLSDSSMRFLGRSWS